MRSDEQLKADQSVIWLLAQVELGHIPRGTGVMDPYLLNGVNYRLQLVWLRKDELVEMPISGPPRLAPRGLRLLTEAVEEHRNDQKPLERS